MDREEGGDERGTSGVKGRSDLRVRVGVRRKSEGKGPDGEFVWRGGYCKFGR